MLLIAKNELNFHIIANETLHQATLLQDIQTAGKEDAFLEYIQTAFQNGDDSIILTIALNDYVRIHVEEIRAALQLSKLPIKGD